MQKSRRAPLWRVLASVLTGALFAVAAGGAALPAHAASGPTVTVAEAPRAGGTVTVTGSGFAATEPGIYLSVRAVGSTASTYTVWLSPSQVTGTLPGLGATAPMNADGSFAVLVTVPAYSDGTAYEVFTRQAHGGQDQTQRTTAPIVYAAPPATATTTSLAVSPVGSAVVGTDVTLTATVSPAASGSVEFFDGSSSLGKADAAQGVATVSTKSLAIGARSLTAAFTPADPAAYAASASAVVAFEVVAVPTAPTLTVSQTSGLDAAGATITVTGRHFDASAASRHSAGKAGVYVQVGWLSENWRPSAGAASATRSNAYNVWIADVVNTSAPLKWSENADGTADFTWTVAITKGALDAKKLDGGTLAVFTTGGGGVPQAVNELAVPISFATPETPTDPTLSFRGGSTVAQGGTLTVDAAGLRAGDVVTAVVRSEPVTVGSAIVSQDGTASFGWTVPSTFAAGAHTFELTVGGTVVASAPFTVTAATVLTPVDPPAVEPGQAPSCVARAVSGASIEWGVKESFRSYIEGPIAKGSASIGWGSGSGAYSTETNRGRVSFGGTASFTGHGGALDMTLSNPRVQVTSATTATLIVNVTSKGYNGSSDVARSGVAFATLSLPAASTSNGRISWSNAQATLTAAGAEAFAGFYSAGAALDPVSFAFPLGAEVPCDSTTDGTAGGTLAATGGSAPVDALWLGFGMLALGAVAFAAHRRRAAQVS